MINKRKAPSIAGTLTRGIKQNIHYKNKALRLSGQIKSEAKQIADVLIKLQHQFPDFFRDIKPDDPDLDMESGFKNFPKRKNR